MGVTIKEVAKAAGVSSAAVSRVLHGRGKNIRVSEARAEEIRRVARELKYVPNALARSLRVNRTHTLGILFENFSGIADGPLYIVELLDGIAREAFPRHYRLSILAELDHDDVPGSLGDGHLDGVIWCRMARDEKVISQIANCPIPIVTLNAPSGEILAPFVACDNRQGIELALDHLFALGHRNLTFVHEDQEADAPDCIERLQAFREGVDRRGGHAEVVVWEWQLNEFKSWDQGDCTAVIAWSERCAGVLLRHAESMGLSIPERLSIVGFDSTGYCDATRPRLTAVRQPIREMGQHAAQALLSIIEDGENLFPQTIFPCSFDVRDSTAPARQ